MSTSTTDPARLTVRLGAIAANYRTLQGLAGRAAVAGVVKADGSIAGYRWGVQRKRRLINMEGVA